MKSRSEYKTVGEWYEDAKKEDYSIPVSLCADLNNTMKEKGLNFSDAFDLLLKNTVFVQVNKVFIHDLAGYKSRITAP